MRVFNSLLFLFLAIPPLLVSRQVVSDSSRLSDPQYVDRHIQSISDNDLLSAFVYDQTGLDGMRAFAAAGNVRAAYEAWGTYWAEKERPRYATQNFRMLLDTDLLMTHEDIRRHCAIYPEERDSALGRAELLMRNIIRVWGDVVVRFDGPVDFNRDVGQSGKYGFHYWIWSRPLNSAYILTGDERYLAKFDEFFNRWYEQRNSITRGFPELDVVYYELGLGIRNRMFLEHYFLPYRNRSWQTHERMLKTMLAAGRWLYELQKWEGYRSGNWQAHGSYMLVQLALVFPEFRESSEWLAMGLRRLREHLRDDWFEDGGHSERSPRNYTMATYLIYRNLFYLLHAYQANPEFAEAIRSTMGKTVDWWLTMITPTGEIPAINDSHRGLFPTLILHDAAAFFHKPEVSGVMQNLFGIPAGAPPVLPSWTSRHMPASGFTVMRTDWTKDAFYMNINYGPWNGSHTHSDMLNFELYAYGKALAVDAGLGLTYDDPLYIPWYRSSRAHNMVVVNDQDMERETVKGENVVWNATPLLEYFSADHQGYRRFGVSHRRQIIFVKPHYWLIVDSLASERVGDTLSWYLHSPERLIPFGSGFRSFGTPGLVLLPATKGWVTRRGTGMAASTQNLTPGTTQENNWIAFDRMTVPGATQALTVLLYPFQHLGDTPVCSTPSPGHVRVATGHRTDDILFPERLRDGAEIESDANVVLITREGTLPIRFTVLHATWLKFQGKTVWTSPSKTSADGTIPQ